MFLGSELVWNVLDAGSVKIRRANDPEKTRRYFEHGDTARELIGSVSFTYESARHNPVSGLMANAWSRGSRE